MNINLSKAAANKKNNTKGYALGLNSRGAAAMTALGGGDSSSSGEDESPAATGCEAVNRAIAKEQAALCARAAAAADANPLYDYNGTYKSFHPHPTAKKSDVKINDSKQSRYTGDLLKAAEQRKHERDIAYERKVAREQAAEEEADPEVRGKDKFVTAAYKRKLEERKVWQEQEDKQTMLEEANDVAKRTDGVGMASFYGNLNKNVAMGGGTNEKKNPLDSEKEDPRTTPDAATASLGFLDGFAKGDEGCNVEENDSATRSRATLPRPELSLRDDNVDAEDPKARRKRMRLLREKKVEDARARYYQRQGMSNGKE